MLTYLAKPWMHPARSFVITPFSTVSTQTFSNVWENLEGDDTPCWVHMMSHYIRLWHMSSDGTSLNHQIAYFIKSVFPSSLPLCSRPLVHAKMLAMGLVLVGLPYKWRTQPSYDTESTTCPEARVHGNLIMLLFMDPLKEGHNILMRTADTKKFCVHSHCSSAENIPKWRLIYSWS